MMCIYIIYLIFWDAFNCAYLAFLLLAHIAVSHDIQAQHCQECQVVKCAHAPGLHICSLLVYQLPT